MVKTMKKIAPLSILVILSAALISATFQAKGTDDFKYLPDNWKMKPLNPTMIDGGVPRGMIESDESERVSYEYINVGQELDPSHGVAYGPYNPYEISFRVNTVSPSGYKLTVTIKVNGVAQWSGLLGAGQSSPTITCSGGNAEVLVVNFNDVSVAFTGTITLVIN